MSSFSGLADDWLDAAAMEGRPESVPFPPFPPEAAVGGGANLPHHIEEAEYIDPTFASHAACLPKAARQVISILEAKWESTFTNTDSVAHMVARPPGAQADELATQWVQYLADEIPDEYAAHKQQLLGQGPTRAAMLGFFKKCLRTSEDSLAPPAPVATATAPAERSPPPLANHVADDGEEFAAIDPSIRNNRLRALKSIKGGDVPDSRLPSSLFLHRVEAMRQKGAWTALRLFKTQSLRDVAGAAFEGRPSTSGGGKVELKRGGLEITAPSIRSKTPSTEEEFRHRIHLLANTIWLTNWAKIQPLNRLTAKFEAAMDAFTLAGYRKPSIEELCHALQLAQELWQRDTSNAQSLDWAIEASLENPAVQLMLTIKQDTRAPSGKDAGKGRRDRTPKGKGSPQGTSKKGDWPKPKGRDKGWGKDQKGGKGDKGKKRDGTPARNLGPKGGKGAWQWLPPAPPIPASWQTGPPAAAHHPPPPAPSPLGPRMPGLPSPSWAAMSPISDWTSPLGPNISPCPRQHQPFGCQDPSCTLWHC